MITILLSTAHFLIWSYFGLRLSNLIKETTYLLTYLLTYLHVLEFCGTNKFVSSAYLQSLLQDEIARKSLSIIT